MRFHSNPRSGERSHTIHALMRVLPILSLTGCALGLVQGTVGPPLAQATESAPIRSETKTSSPPPVKVPSEAIPTILSHGVSFVDAVNDTTESAEAARRQTVQDIYAASVLDSVPEERLVELFERLRRDFGRLDLHHSEVFLSSLHVFVRSELSGEWKDLQFRIETTAPYGLEGLRFIADVAEPVYLPNGDVRSAETVDWINGYLETLIAEDGLAGKVLLARGDLPFFHRTFGYVDAAQSEPVLPATLFNLGSGNKMFTALSTMLLVEQGKLSLDVAIADYLPSFPDRELAGRITIRQLLSHSSGLGDYWTDDFEHGGWKATRLVEVEPFVYQELAENGLHFEPGTNHRYSNSGFLLLGRIIENVSGEDYFDFVRTHIYEPLGMAHTDSYLTDGSVPNLAPPLVTNSAPSRRDEPETESKDLPESGSSLPLGTGQRWSVGAQGLRGTSAGGGFSTTSDMLKFLRGVLAGRIVSASTLAGMTTPQLADGEDPAHAFAHGLAYGLGFLLEQSGSGAVSWGHGGIARGVNFELRYFPESDITFIAFCNQDNGAYDDLRRNLTKLITGDR